MNGSLGKKSCFTVTGMEFFNSIVGEYFLSNKCAFAIVKSRLNRQRVRCVNYTEAEMLEF